MTTEHTQGRIWVNAEKTAIVHAEDGRIACPPNHSQRWAWDANARRIAACWNACQGSSTESLEENGAASFESAVELVKQRDDLMTALTRLSAAALARDTTMGDQCGLFAAQAELRDANKLASAAIAKATGSAS